MEETEKQTEPVAKTTGSFFMDRLPAGTTAREYDILVIATRYKQAADVRVGGAACRRSVGAPSAKAVFAATLNLGVPEYRRLAAHQTDELDRLRTDSGQV